MTPTLLELADQLAEELEAELRARYDGMLDHPAMEQRFNRDMSTVEEWRRARARTQEGVE